MKTIITAFLTVLVVSASFAQNKDSLWTSQPMKSEIKWQVLASDGTLIAGSLELASAATSGSDVYTSIVGIDPQTGNIKWKYPTIAPKTGGVQFSNVDFIPNTPFFKIPRGPLTIIDPFDGHVILDAAKEGITAEEGFGYLLQSGHLWVSGTVNGDRCITLFELSSGKKLWSNADLLRENNKVASKLGKFAAMTGSAVPNKKPIALLGTPINNGNDKVVLATSNGLFNLNIADGKVNWQAELPDPNKGKMVKVEVDIDFLRLIPGPDKFYVVKAAYITAYGYDGKPAWAEPVKTSGPIAQIIYDEKGLILCPGSSNVKGMVATGYLKMVNEKTGAELWGDGIKFSGGVIKTYVYTDKGLAVVMTNPETEKNMVNFVDVTAGKFNLPKSVNLEGNVQYIELVPKGLLYKTDRTVNILDLETDKSLFPFPVQSKKDRAILSVASGDNYYFYSDEDQQVYEINKAAGTGKQLTKAKIAFQGGETPSSIEVRKEGVALYGEQNVTLIGFDGVAKFNSYNPGVQNFSTVMKNVGNALDMMNAVMSVVNAGTQMSSALNGSSAGRNQYDKTNQAFAAVGSAAYVVNLKQFGSIQNRLKASAQSQGNVVMMTKIDGRPTLVAVSKDTGVIGSKIPLARKDDQPMYLIDSVSGILFYSPKGKNLIGWSNTPNSVSGFALSR